MTDNEIIRGLKCVLDKYLHHFGLNDFQVSRSGQPSDQASCGDADSDIKTQIFLHQISHTILQNSPEKFENKNIHNRAALIEISVFHYFNYEDINSITSDDVAEMISDILFDDVVIQELRRIGIRIESRTSIRPIFIINDKDRYENFASFDIQITYQTARNKLDSGQINNVVTDIKYINREI